MGLLDRLRPKPPADAQGHAIVIRSTPYANTERPGVIVKDEIRHNDLWYLNLGWRPHELTLEVHLAGEQPYETTGRFRVPARFCHGSEVRLPTGVELPVKRTGGPDQIEVEWRKFAATREERKQVKRHAAREYNDRVVEGLERNQPEQQARMRESNTGALPTWVAAVKAGKLKRKQFEQSAETLLRLEQIDPEALAAARAELDAGGF